MRKTTNRPSAPAAGCEECARELGAILADHTLQAGFRPVADFERCAILGFIAAVRGPAGMMNGSAARLARVARQLGLLREFSRAAAGTAVQRFMESASGGLLFLPLPEGAVEAEGDLAADILAATAAASIPAERVVLLVPALAAERFDRGAETLARLRAAGFGLAARGLGCELAERHLWALTAPDFVVLDEHLFDGLDLATVSHTGLSQRLAAEAARGRRVVADGIRSSNDFNALHHLGIRLGAGDFIGRAGAAPTRALSAAAHKAIAAACECGGGPQAATGGVLERLLVKLPPVASASTADEVFFLFERTPELRAVAVVDGDAPRGLISRYEMVDNMARPYRHELYGRKPCTRFMDPQPLVVDIGVSLQELSEIVVGADPRHLISGFIITDRGRYLGMGSVQDLVREVTAMQMEAAKYANPLTQLPGNVPINHHIDNLLAAGEPFCIAYCDLDHFKPFNDVYGYAKGDEVIQLTARALAGVVDAERDFLGHIGGDDFVLVLRSPDWEARCRAALDWFGAAILDFFSNDDIERGGYVTENRKGELEFHRLTSLSIGAVEATPGMFQNHLQVSKVAAEVKKKAKAMPGNSLFINQRHYPSEREAPAPAGHPEENHP